MSKRLKSFHKLFFIVIFSILFSGVIGSSSSPDLPEKIAPELEQIEALPRRTKPAELNIEVTKIKSEPLEEVYIDRKNKNIYVDFSKKREQALRGVRNAEELDKKYNLVISENIQSSGEVVGKGRTKMATNPQVMTYETAELDGKKMLKIPYENESKKLYISVQENNQVIKVYSMDIENAPLINEKTVIEDKTVIINLTKGIETYEGKKLVFNLDGTLNYTGIGNEVGTSSTDLGNEVRVDAPSGFINSFPGDTSITIKTSADTQSSTKTSTSKSGDMQLYFPAPHDGFVFNFYKGGELSLRFQQIRATGAKSYTFNITHTSGGQTKNHTLIINSQSQPQPTRQLMNRTSSLQNVIIEDIEGLSTNTEYNFGTLGIEQVGNGSDLVDKSNPFPALALGNFGNFNQLDAWHTQIPTNASMPKRNPVITTYNSNNSNNSNNLNIPMEMYFSNTTTSITNPEGGTVTLLTRGTPTNVLGAFGDAKRERMNTSLKGKINLDSTNLNNLLTEFRKINRPDVTLTSNSPSDKQISYVVAQKTPTTDYYTFPTLSELNSSLVTDKKVEYLNYPSVILKKTKISEELTLNLTSDFKLDNSIIFTSSGITSIPGASSTPTNTRNLKSLHFAGSFKLKNNLNETAVIDVDATGNSVSSNEFIINNGSNELKLSLQYKNRYPEIKILNAAKAGTYALNIVHYEPSTLERLNYTLNIVLQNDLTLPEPVMVRTNNLNEFIIEDDIVTEKYQIVSGDLGTLAMQQIRQITSGNVFPFIALGQMNDENGKIGWKFNSSSEFTKSASEVNINYKNNLDTIYELNLNMFLEKKADSLTGTSIEVKNNNKYSGLGVVNLTSNIDNLESIENSLKANLITTNENLEKILTNFRSRSEREIILTPQENISNQISYVIGDYTAGKYTIPTNLSVSSAEKKIDNIKYPNVKIVKPLLEENITLTIPSTYDIKTPILFTDKGIDNDSLTITSDEKRYLKSLHYASFFNVNGGDYKEIGNGTPVEFDVTLKSDNGKVLTLKVKYDGRYPQLTFLNKLEAGKYILTIRHFDPTNKLKRLEYTINIVVLDSLTPIKEFEVTSNIRDILIFLNDKTVESPDNWIKVVQLVSDKRRFPVIGINRPSWEIKTDRPLNPIDKRPTAVLNLESFGKIEVPVNIRETPYQNTQKFLVYDRGDMTNRNIAVGAYTPLNSKENSGLNNKVQVDFEILLSEDNKKSILEYAQAEFIKDSTKTKVIIPYSKDVPEGYHKIYSIRGLQKDTSKIFDVNKDNILDYGILDFPKIVVLKEKTIDRKKANLVFSNPIPKSNGDISGTFDIAFGLVSPNNLQSYNNPSSLNISGDISPTWPGFTTIPEYHKIKISSSTESKEFTTTESGEMKGTQTIISGKNSYVFMKGIGTPLSIGILKWDFNKKTDIIKFEHRNSNGRIIAEDSYEITLPEFNLLEYLNKKESTLLDKIGTTKSIFVTANARQDFIELGALKLQNYQKDITKTDTDSIGVQIGVDTIELSLSSTSDGATLKGKLVFDDGKTSLTNPNEIGNLKFIITSPTTDYDNIVGKTFVLDRTSANPLVFMNGGGQQNEILNKITIKLQDSQSGQLPEMSFVSTLNSKTISESDLIKTINGTEKGVKLPGSATLKQLTGGQGNSVPVIAIGDYNEWKLSGGDRRYPRTNRKSIIAKYQIGDTTIDVEPELLNPISSIDGSINSDKAKEYKEITESKKVLTALTYVICRDSKLERISAGIKLNIDSSQLSKILEELKKIPGDRVELKPLSSNIEDSNNQAKIAYIHGRDVGRDNDCTEGKKLYIPTNTTLTTKYAYELLPSIFIEKEKLYKNVEINFLPAYKLNDEIKFTPTTITLPTAGGIEVRPNDDFKILEGLNYKHKIRMTLPDGTTETYETTDSGSLTTPIVKTIEKNGKTITLFINYTSWNETIIKLTNRIGSQYFDIKLEHIDIISEDIRKTTNIRINSGVSEFNIKNGEMNFVISSRYNATETPGQLISNPLAITSTGITYQTEVLDLKLLNGDFPDAPGDKSVEVNGISITELVEGKITLAKGTILKVTKKDGNLIIKPLKWNYNAKDNFTITYKNENTITDRYTFNVVCPEFFVASVGVLDFGKLYKIGDPTKTVTTDIKLEYIDGTVEAEYSLDVSQANPDGKLTNSLFLNDEKTLLVEELKITPKGTVDTQNRILELTGTINGPSVMKTNPGVYQKTIQILIHLQ